MRKLLLLASMLFATIWVSAQVVTVVGDTASLNSYLYGPIYRSSSTSSFNYSTYGYLFESSELGWPSGTTINKIAWKKQSANTLTGGTLDLKIIMKNTTLNSYGGTAVRYDTLTAANRTTVFNTTAGNISGGANTWVEYTLTTPFTYTGGVLEVVVDFNRDGATSNGVMNFYYSNATNKGVGIASSSAPTAASTTSSSYSGRRPATRFTVAYPAGACLPPSNLMTTAASSSSINVSWTSGGASNSLVEYGPAGFTLGTGTKSYVSGTSTTLTGLNPNTTYDIYVKDSCATNASPFIGPNTVTTPCAGQLSGTYTVNSALATGGTNFASFADLASELNACGVSGPVTVNVVQGTYSGRITLSSISGASATNTITIQAASTNTMDAVITDSATTSSDNYLVKFDGASHVTLSGLVFRPAAGGSYGRCLDFSASGSHINILNNTFDGVPTTSTSSFYALIYNNSGSTNKYDNCLIRNNTFQKGSYGMYWYGTSSSGPYERGNFLDSNNISDYTNYGIYAYAQTEISINGNTIVGNQPNSGSSQYGIYAYYSDSLRILGNSIEVYGNASYGIWMGYSDNDATNRALVANNAISNQAGTSTVYGIYPFNCYYLDIVHNSINVTGGSSTSGRGVYLNSSSTGTYGNIRLQNNSVVNVGGGYAVEVSSAAAGLPYVSSSNYNNIYGTGTTLARIGTTNYADLSSYSTATTFDANSVSGDPLYTSTTNLTPLAGTNNNVGSPFAAVTIDINGAARSSTTPDIGAYEFTPASCTPSSNFASYATYADSVALNWIGGAGATYTIEYGVSGFTQGAGTSISGIADTFRVVTGLSAQTSYDFYLQDNCTGGNGNSIWVGPITATTLCNTKTLPYTQNFDGGFPICWSTNDPTNVTVSSCSRSGDALIVYTPNGNYAESPLIDASSVNSVKAVWWYRAGDGSCGNAPESGDNLNVEYWNGTSWVFLRNYDGSTAPTTFTKDSVIISAGLTSGFKIRMVMINGTTSAFDSWSFDDVRVEQGPACSPPSGLGIVGRSNTAATLYWTGGGAANFNVEYGVSGFTQGAGTVVASANDTLTITGLNAATAYQFYVQDSCGVGNVSAFSGPFSFSTAACDTATQCTFDITLSDDFGDGWNGTVVSVYQNGAVVATLGGSAFTSSTGSPAGDTLKTTIALCDSVDAYFVITTGSAGSPYWSAEIGVDAFAPFGAQVLAYPNTTGATQGDTIGMFQALCSPPSCSPPSALGVVSTTTNSATLYWTSGGAANANVQYGLTGFSLGAGTTVSTSNDTIVITGLSSATNYSFYVQDSCAAGNSSAYVGPLSFSTAVCDTSAQCTFDVTLSDDFGDGWNGTEVSVYQNGVVVAVLGSNFDGTAGNPAGDTLKTTIALCDSIDAYFVITTGSSGSPYWSSEIGVDAFAPYGLQVLAYPNTSGATQGDTIGMFQAICTAPSCSQPTALGLDTATTNSATVYWSGANSSSLGYAVEYGPVGFVQGQGTLIASANDTLTITGLASSSCFQFYVLDSCSATTQSTWAGPFTFCTACGVFNAPFFESFDGTGIPNCWTTFNTTGNTSANARWKNTSGNWMGFGAAGVVDNTGNSGYAIGVDGSSAVATDTAIILESPFINLSTLTTPTLNFDIYQNNLNSAANMRLLVDVYDGANWNDSVISYRMNAATWQSVIVDLGTLTFTGNAKLRFRVNKIVGAPSPFHSDIIIDNVVIDNRPACYDPTMLSVTATTTSSVSLSWMSDTTVTSSVVEFGLSGFVLGSGTRFATAAGSGTISGLAPGSCFDFYVLDSCSGGNTTWLGPITACTQAICNVSTMPTGTNDSTGCGGGYVQVSATAGNGGSDVAWIIDGVVRSLSSTYEDTIGGSTIFNAHDYVAQGPSQRVGPLPSIATAGFGNFTNGQFIQVLDTIYLDSTTVRANGYVNAQVIIRDSAGVDILQRGEVFETDSAVTGNYQVPVGILLTPGYYFIGIDFDVTAVSLGALFRATSGAVFPYVAPGKMSIYGVNFAGPRYYYTFDIVLRGACLGTATPVLGYVPGASAGSDATVAICESNTSFNLASALGAHTGGGTWTDLSTTGGLTDSIFNASIPGAGGPYNFRYVVGGAGGCANDTAFVTVNVDTLFNVGVDSTGALCTNRTGLVALRPYLGADGGGTWADLDASGILVGDRIRPSQGTAGTYRYRYTMPANGSCPAQTATVTIVLSNPGNAGPDLQDSVCLSTPAINLNTYLGGTVTTGGTWKTTNATAALTAGVFTPSLVPAGNATYTFRYVVPANGGCPADSAVLTMYVCDDTKLTEHTLDGIALYPNPTNGRFFVEDLSGAPRTLEVNVMGVDGKVLKSLVLNQGGKQEVDLTAFAAGVYTIRVRGEIGYNMYRVVLQR